MKILCCIAIGAVFGVLNAQSINISDFYYRDFLDFGQNKGAFSGNGSVTLTKKDGTSFTIPQTPNFSASSNYGSLTSIGRGFAVTANHVSSPENAEGLLNWGLTKYDIAKESIESQQLGYDEKFLRLNKYVVEGQVGMLDFENNVSQSNRNEAKEKQNIIQFKDKLNNFKDKEGNIYIYQAGSGIVTLRETKNQQTFNTSGDGTLKGGGFGTLGIDSIQYGCESYQSCGNVGMWFYYYPDSDFNNRITSGDSGSGIYAYDSTNQKWVLLGVVSKEWNGQNRAFISAVSSKDFAEYQKYFEQKIDLGGSSNNWTLEKPLGGNIQLKNGIEKGIDSNKDLIFSGGGNVEVKTDIDRLQSNYAGGFVFESATSQTTYKFTNESGKNYFFKGSGLDIGENVLVEWALGTQKDDSLHKIGKGELKIIDSTGDNGTLKLGEGKVTLDTTKKAFENIYITSGRGELALIKDKAEALGATKNDSNNMNILKQDSANDMGFYFGSGGGKLDLGGNNLRVNTIAANDSGAIITNSTSNKATLRIQGFGYDENGKRQTDKKADTMIHASIGESSATNGTNIDIVYKSDDSTKNTDAHLIFDGHINTSGSLSTENSNIALQGHATTHATISNESIRNQIANAENGTQKGMPNYMDLSKPSHLEQPDWDNRTFKFGNIDLKSSNLTLGRNATLESNITADKDSSIKFGGNVKHFIDNKDGKNVTGSGFSYQQEVESGDLSAEMQEIANSTISYKGTITADGGSIQSNIWNFNASLDLQNDANLAADYLTLTSTDSVKLSNGASASVKTLKLQDVSNDNLTNIFQISNDANSKQLSVTEALWFDSVGSVDSPFNLDKLEKANVNIDDIKSSYDIIAEKSTIKGESKDLTANVTLFDSANLALKKLTLTKTNANDTKNEQKIKDSVYLHGESSQNTATKLTLSESLNVDSLDSASIILSGKSEISAPKIAFSNVKDGLLLLDSESKLIGANGNSANVEVSGADSSLKIGILGDKKFNINAQGGSKITLGLLQSSLSKDSSANFSGKISASNSSTIDTTALESITASVNLSDSVSLSAKNIKLNSTYSTIKLNNSVFTADTITADNNLVDIDLKGKSQLFVNDSWNFGNIKQLKGESESHIFVKDATYAKDSNAPKTIGVNTTINGTLSLDKVGAVSSKSDDRFKSLTFSDNLTFGENAKITITLDSNIKKSDSNSVTLGQYFTLLNAKEIFDNRADSRIDFIFGDDNDKFFVVSKFDGNELKFKFLESAPDSFAELNKNISHAQNRYSEILEALTQASPNDEAIDIATRTDDYSVLDKRIQRIDSDLNQIAQGNKTRQTRNLLFSNDQTINTRISQVRLAQRSEKHLRFAQNDAMYKIQTLLQGAVRSDAMPSYDNKRESNLPNSVWLNVGGGYFGGDSKMGFGATNIGYDRLFDAQNGSVLVGAMLGFGGSKAHTGAMSENALFYNVGLYLHSLFGTNGEMHHEIQSNISFSISDNRKSIESKSAKNTAFGILFALYYKYNFIVAQNDAISHALKPVVLVSVGYNRNGAFDNLGEYTQKSYDSTNLSYGLGVEYNAAMSASFYSIALTLKDMAWSSEKNARLSLNGARNFIGYSVESAPRFSVELNLVGSHKITPAFYIQYGIAGMVDSGSNYGAKGDIKFGYKF